MNTDSGVIQREHFETWIHDRQQIDDAWPDGDSANRFWMVWQAAERSALERAAQLIEKRFTSGLSGMRPTEAICLIAEVRALSDPDHQKASEVEK